MFIVVLSRNCHTNLTKCLADIMNCLHYKYLFFLSYYFLSNLLALCHMSVSLSYWLTVFVCLTLCILMCLIILDSVLIFCIFNWCLCNFVLAGWAFGPVFIVVLNINCLTKNDLSGILDTTDTNFLDPWWAGTCG